MSNEPPKPPIERERIVKVSITDINIPVGVLFALIAKVLLVVVLFGILGAMVYVVLTGFIPAAS